MPYLDSKIDKHKSNCGNPVGKRLYIRDYDDNGKQRFTSWGLTCTTCGVIVKEKYQHNLTKKEISDREFHMKVQGTKFGQALDKLVGGPSSWEQDLERHRKYKVIDKLKRLHRKKQGNDPITPKENGLRIRIKNLPNTVYYFHKDEIKWDNELVQEFLNLEPRPSYRDLKHVWDSRPENKLRMLGFTIPITDKPGYYRYDGKDHEEERLKIIQDSALAQQGLMRAVIEDRKMTSLV